MICVACKESDDAVLKRTISVGGAGFRQALKSRLVAGVIIYYWPYFVGVYEDLKFCPPICPPISTWS